MKALSERIAKPDFWTWMQHGSTIAKLSFALAASLIFNGALFAGLGIDDVPPGLLPYLPAAVAVLVAVVIAPEAYTNGFGQTPQFWRRLHKRLLALLTIALVVRGVGVGLVANALGFDHETTLLLATGLTATDPAAIAIALTLAGKDDNPLRLQEVLWLYTIESLVNDGLASIAFEMAHGDSLEFAVRSLGLTIFFGIALAFTDEGARWYMRERSRWAHSEREPAAEIIVVLLFYIGFASAAAISRAFPIGTVVLGALIADYLFIHRLPGGRYSEALEQKRQHFAHLWAEWGLVAFVFVAGLLMPYEQLVSNPTYLLHGLAILGGGILASRLVYEVFYLTFRTKQTSIPLAIVSILLTGTLVGVPTFVAVSLYEGGHPDAAYVLFAAILASWLLVPPAVWVIIRVKASLKADEARHLIDPAAPRTRFSRSRSGSDQPR